MTRTSWAFTNASAVGTAHQRRGETCQDSSLVVSPRINYCDQAKILFAAVADGAGTAKHSAVGSSLAVRVFKDEICRMIGPGQISLNKDHFRTAILKTANHIEEMALRSGCNPRDYASTLVSVILLPDHAWHIQIGDGAAVFGYGERRFIDFWPAKGEYGNETFFLTDCNVLESLHVSQIDLPDEVTLFTDGLESIALNLTEKQVHPPFYDSFYRILCRRNPGYQRDLSKQLRAWLQTDLVTNRTDDDKSLVLIARSQTSA